MNVALFGKSFTPERIPHLLQLLQSFQDAGASLVFYKPFAELISPHLKIPQLSDTFLGYEDMCNGFDILLSVGGDGTMLDTVPVVRDSGVPILGINMGRMGFLSSIAKHEINEAVERIVSGKYIIEERSLISLEQPTGLFGDLHVALNELSIFRQGTTSLIKINVFVDEVFVNSYWADGLLIATPTGSTAYSLSAGGPILTPDSAVFVITPIATHNLSVRPIVIPDRCLIKLKVTGRHTSYSLNLDSRSAVIGKSVDLIVKKAGFHIRLVKMEGKDFYTTIREKLLWGIDIRN
jgi:NAD+ kinase